MFEDRISRMNRMVAEHGDQFINHHGIMVVDELSARYGLDDGGWIDDACLAIDRLRTEFPETFELLLGKVRRIVIVFARPGYSYCAEHRTLLLSQEWRSLNRLGDIERVERSAVLQHLLACQLALAPKPELTVGQKAGILASVDQCQSRDSELIGRVDEALSVRAFKKKLVVILRMFDVWCRLALKPTKF